MTLILFHYPAIIIIMAADIILTLLAVTAKHCKGILAVGAGIGVILLLTTGLFYGLPLGELLLILIILALICAAGMWKEERP